MQGRHPRTFSRRRPPGALASLVSLFCAGAALAEGLPLAFVQTPREAGQAAGRDLDRTILAGRYRLGMRIAVADLGDIAGSVSIITDGLAAAADPVFSHDGSQLMLCAQKSPDEPMQIWRLADDFTSREEVVTCAADCISPLFMPDGKVVFASLLAGEYEVRSGQRSFSLYESRPYSDDPSRLTFNPSSDFGPTILRDGRIVYSSWQHVGNHFWPRGAVALMLINSDGTGVFPLTGNHRGPWLKRGATPLADDRIAFVQSDALQDLTAGELVALSINDPFAPYARLLTSGAYQVASIAAMPDGSLVLSARPRDRSHETFGLYALRDGVLTLLYDDPNFHELSPAIGASTDRPERRLSTVVPGTPHGFIVVLNCYETDRTDQHRLRSGAVKSVRLLERGGNGAGPVILGEAPLSPDGSISLKVPSDRPLRLQLLDRDGSAIMNERAWFWVRPNERRVCIGCHENRELSPPNSLPLATLTEPVDMTTPAQRRTVTFIDDIRPILEASCALTDCHAPPRPSAALDLTSDAAPSDRFDGAYRNLMKPQDNKPAAIGGRLVHPGDSRSSPLIWMLSGLELAPQYPPAPFDRPLNDVHPDRPLTQSQLRLLQAWIDLGAPHGVLPGNAHEQANDE